MWEIGLNGPPPGVAMDPGPHTSGSMMTPSVCTESPCVHISIGSGVLVHRVVISHQFISQSPCLRLLLILLLLVLCRHHPNAVHHQGFFWGGGFLGGGGLGVVVVWDPPPPTPHLQWC